VPKRLLLVEEDQGQEHPRDPRWEELREILDSVLVQLIEHNQGERNLLEFLEAQLIRLALEQTSNTQSQAAKQLGIPRKRVERRVRKYQLK
jgi:DNA-binding NtrC family response regulator